MSALTPDCDPDMSHCGQPWKGKSTPGASILSAAVLLTLLGVSLAVVATRAVSDAFDFVALPIAVLTAVVLVRRAVRLIARGASAVAARVPTTVAVHRSQPVS
jgi:mannose/fructose/N-acetylgalactosamine-specific phosphotransferase system component IIC